MADLEEREQQATVPEPERLLKTMASHEDWLNPNNRETDEGRSFKTIIST